MQSVVNIGQLKVQKRNKREIKADELAQVRDDTRRCEWTTAVITGTLEGNQLWLFEGDECIGCKEVDMEAFEKLSARDKDVFLKVLGRRLLHEVNYSSQSGYYYSIQYI